MNMPKPTKRADGRWTLALPRKTGESRRYVYAMTQEAVLEKWLIATGQGPVRVRPGSIAEFVVTTFAPWQAPRVQPDSLRRYDAIWKLHLGKDLGHLLFSELEPAIVEAALIGCGAPASQALGRGVLKQIVTLAIAHGWATDRELAMVRLAKIKPRKAKERRDVAQRADELLRNIEAAGHWAEGPIWAAMTLGLRKAELCGLRVTDLGEDNVLTLRHQRDHRTGDRERLKHRESGETRRIALPEPVAARLRNYMSAGSIYFFTDDAGRPISYNNLSRYIEPYQPAEPLTIHDLRSAAVSRLVDLGVDDLTIMDIVGHQSREMLAIYRDKRDQRIADALSRQMSRTTTSDNQGG
jgi:integrase